MRQEAFFVCFRVHYNPVEVEMSLPGGSGFSFSPRQGRNANGTLFSFTLLELGILFLPFSG